MGETSTISRQDGGNGGNPCHLKKGGGALVLDKVDDGDGDDGDDGDDSCVG